MHILVVTFNLNDMTHDQWVNQEAPRLAPSFAHLPGLLSKVWLADEATNTYGGIYVWRDSAAADAFLASDLGDAVRAHPNIANLSAHQFTVLSDVTRITQPEVEVVRADTASGTGAYAFSGRG